jgi:hypothetical protein
MTDEPQNRFARVAMDDLRNEWLVLEPLNPDDRRVEREAIPLPPTAGLARAEQLAAAFNAGESSGFWTNPGQVLTGFEIPPLHYLPRVGWKQCTVRHSEDYTPAQKAVAALHLATTGASGAIPQHFALFVRYAGDAGDDGTAGGVLLLSPAAAQYADRFPGDWTDAHDIDGHGWTLLYGDDRDRAALGLRPASRG